MPYGVHLRDNRTGEVRVYRCPSDWRAVDDYGDPDPDLWWWTGGNMGCDCNRGQCFREAGGEDWPGDAACGQDRYSLLGFDIPGRGFVPVDQVMEADR